jgi:roadblock/LC7 domain-containing protein
MSDLDQLLQLPGSIAAFRISDRGELYESKIADESLMDASVLDMVGHVCIANTSIATMQARGWEKLTGMSGFYPINGFTMVGMDWSVVVCCNTGVVLKNDAADYQAAYDALNG